MHHVHPMNDLREHVLNGDPCPCLPRERDGVLIHNSYDAREVGETCRIALDLLGMAHPGPWTDEERDAYEHAIQILDMHWPAKPSETVPFRP